MNLLQQPLPLCGLWLPPSAQINARLSQWLLAPESLTAKLKQITRQFRVEVLYEGHIQDPRLIAQLCQQMPTAMLDGAYRVRQVLLYCDEQPWVFASTLIPEKTLLQGNQFLSSLGEKPLGEALFQHPSVQRGKIEVSEFALQSLLVEQLSQQLNMDINRSLWGRRSVFNIEQAPLIVSEIFLPCSHAY